jgi:hypothetical protein
MTAAPARAVRRAALPRHAGDRPARARAVSLVIPRRVSRWVEAIGALALLLALQATVARAQDFSGYQALLDEYLIVTSKPGEPIATEFDYTRLYRNPEHSKYFAGVRQQLFGVSPKTMDEKTRLAWAINAYNFLVIETVTDHLFEPVQRINKGGRRYYFANRIANVNTIDVEGFSFFEAGLVEVDGTTYNLNAFERTFVFEGFDHNSNGKPPAKLDPRAHFALVCAAKGCPPLLPRAYRGDSLDHQLDFAVRNALATPSHLRFEPTVGRLEASSIFDWYKADFGGVEPAFAFLKKYAPSATRKAIDDRKVPWIAAYILWNWDLNHPPGGNEKPWEKAENQQHEVGRSK